MTRFILVRHGQSTANLNAIFAGHYNAEMTEIGHAQAKMSASYIAQNFRVDRVYASDLSRAFCTGQHVADQFGYQAIPTEGLREISAGEWEGRPFSDLPKYYPDAYQVWFADIGNARCPGGESVRELGARVFKTLKQIAAENDEKTIVIATHATPIRALQCISQGGDFNKMKDIPWVTNASVSVAELDGEELRFTLVGEDSQLKGMQSALPVDI